MKRVSCRGSERKWVRGIEVWCLVGACVYGRELLVQIDDNDVRRVRESQGGLGLRCMGWLVRRVVSRWCM